MGGSFDSKLLLGSSCVVYIRNEQLLQTSTIYVIPPVAFMLLSFVLPLVCGSRPIHTKGRLVVVLVFA